MEPDFVTGERAVLFGNKLVVSDLHIGIEYEFYTSGVKIESQTHTMKKRLDKIIRITKPKDLIFLGDIKHKVPGISFQEIREIPDFMNHFAKKSSVTLVMGNHDPGIENMGIKMDVKPTEGFVSDNIYFTHGHTWPDKSFLSCDYLVMGHIQPQIEFRDKLGYRWQEPVWVKAEFDIKEVQNKYGKTTKLPKIVVIPSFNTLVGGLILNKKIMKTQRKEHSGPMMKMIKLKKADIHLLDGTFIGKLKDL